MIRIVSLHKAALAGIAGAVAWEIVLRTLDWAGLPLFDIVRILGTLAFPEKNIAAWWSAGMGLHALFGALWAIFYAYFFWSRLDKPPVLQGLNFVILPASLALLIAFPQLLLMHEQTRVTIIDPSRLASMIAWPQVVGLLLGHLIYGAVLGALYTRPVGYPDDRRPSLPRSTGEKSTSVRTSRNDQKHPSTSFIFASGVECSYPTIENGKWRFDQMEATGHYENWRRDFELACEIGVSHLRWGPPLHLSYRGPGQFDWSFIEEAMSGLKAAGLEPIIDLCHFGVPSWLGDLQNPELPEALAAYAAAFAKRYPWVRLYTPINEMYVFARLSALDGVWNEQRRDEKSFVTAAKHLAKASALMMDAIAGLNADAIFVNSESSEFFQPCCPDPEITRIADFENERRFLPLDLLYVHPLSGVMKSHLFDHGMSQAELDWFLNRKPPQRAILGVDYYEWNEKLIDSEGKVESLGELFGWYVIANQYFERYRRPMMHTETNRLDARDGPRWLWRQWHNVQLLRKAGVPLVGFTWYSLTDQVDWDISMSRAVGTVNPVGLVDLNRDVRPVGLAYKYLIETHRDEPGFRACAPLADLISKGAD